MTLRLGQIADWLGVALDAAFREVVVDSYVIDSRQAQTGSLFFALPGEHADGHDFVEAAIAQGAAAAVVSRPLAGLQAPLLVVSDVQAALAQLGRAARNYWNKTVVAITGSAGKTSTKDAVATLLGAAFPVSKTEGNLNNHLGVPLSLLRIADHAQAAVLEMGMNHAGEISALCGIARPDLGVVTNAGYAHIENFPDGVEGIANAKRELILALPEGAPAILNADDERVCRFAEGLPRKVRTFGLGEAAHTRAAKVQYHMEGADFEIEGVPFRSRVPGRIGVSNISAAVAVARLYGVPLARLAEKTSEIPVGKMRAERFVHAGIQIWNDCYNSNPDAAKAMLDVLRDTAQAFHPQGRAIAVLGEMRELGHWAEPLHRALGNYAVQSGVAVLIGIRGAAQFLIESMVEANSPDRAAFFFDDSRLAGLRLKSLARPGDTVLFKGSRGTRVEQALEAFLGEEGKAA
ncbi:MAG: UDP-N-acetylmuramoyl-tripeptide--D-alanyl-D-alanine ligase [Bryobacter sp.]